VHLSVHHSVLVDCILVVFVASYVTHVHRPHTLTHTHIYICIYIHAHTYTRTHTHTHTYIQLYTLGFISSPHMEASAEMLNLILDMYERMGDKLALQVRETHAHTHTHTHTHTYIHTYTHTCIYTRTMTYNGRRRTLCWLVLYHRTYTFTYTYIHTYTHSLSLSHTHTHIHTHTCMIAVRWLPNASQEIEPAFE